MTFKIQIVKDLNFLTIRIYRGCGNKIELEALIEDITRELTKEVKEAAILTGEPLEKVFAYIDQHYKTEIRVKEIADSINYSPASLAYMVRRLSGRSIYQWVVRRRMEEAARLLQDSGMSIEEIAYTVGYVNLPAFFRQFKKHFRETPGDYRQSLSRQPSSRGNEGNTE